MFYLGETQKNETCLTSEREARLSFAELKNTVAQCLVCILSVSRLCRFCVLSIFCRCLVCVLYVPCLCPVGVLLCGLAGFAGLALAMGGVLQVSCLCFVCVFSVSFLWLTCVGEWSADVSVSSLRMNHFCINTCYVTKLLRTLLEAMLVNF